MQLLRERIIGQDAALNEIEKMLHVVKADFSSPDRPLSVTLMLGPTGVGKTETVRLIADAIYGRPDAFCRIYMNTLGTGTLCGGFDRRTARLCGIKGRSQPV